MSQTEVVRLLTDGGASKEIRMRYDFIDTMEQFVAAAAEDGYAFEVADLVQVLRDAGDSFDLVGNPRRRQIWWS